LADDDNAARNVSLPSCNAPLHNDRK